MCQFIVFDGPTRNNAKQSASWVETSVHLVNFRIGNVVGIVFAFEHHLPSLRKGVVFPIFKEALVSGVRERYVDPLSAIINLVFQGRRNEIWIKYVRYNPHDEMVI